MEAVGFKEWMRPELEQTVYSKIERLTRDRFAPFYVSGRYVDAEGRRLPAYAATHIKLIAVFVSSGEPLDDLEAGLRQIPELETLERVEVDPDVDKRPH